MLEKNKDKIDWYQFSLNNNISKSKLILDIQANLKLRNILINFFHQM